MFEKTEVGSGKSPVKAGDFQLYFMFSHVKYNFFYICTCENDFCFQIYIIFKQYYPVFHYFVYNKY